MYIIKFLISNRYQQFKLSLLTLLGSELISFFTLLIFNILKITLNLVNDPLLVVCEKFGVVGFYLGTTLQLALAWFRLVGITSVFLGIRLLL